MLLRLNELYGTKIAALDGDIGRVKDFYLDDESWRIRYIVVDTGPWLTGRLVLLSPRALVKPDLPDNALHASLRKRQIEDSPSMDSHKPVSRQFEEDYHRYYAWPAYWSGMPMMAGGSVSTALPTSPGAGFPAGPPPETPPQPQLRSTKAMTGYQVQETDGTIGRVSGFLADDNSWAIHELVVETGHWFSGKEILVSPGVVRRIRHEESKVFVSLTKADIQRTAENSMARAGAGTCPTGTFHD